MSQEPLEAAPSRRALRARQADAAQAIAAEPQVAEETAPRPSRRELRAMERTTVDAGAAGAPLADTSAWGEAPAAPAVGLSGRAASLWSEPAEQWAGRAEEWVEQTGSWAVQPAPVAWADDARQEAQEDIQQYVEPVWSDEAQQYVEPVWSDEAQPAWTETALGAEQWAVPEPGRAELWADRAEQWAVPEPAQAERWSDVGPELIEESAGEIAAETAGETDEEPVESGSLIMPAGHLSTGPVTPAQPYGRPAVFLDAPVQPALPPLDLDPEPEPVRARVGLAEPAVVPGPRVAPATDQVALRALALAEASSLAETASPVGTSAREEELADPLGELTLAERLASLPVAPWAVDLEVLEGGWVEHPCEPVDSVPQPHDPVADRVSPQPARTQERPRDLSGGFSRDPQASAASTDAAPAPVDRRASTGSAGASGAGGGSAASGSAVGSAASSASSAAQTSFHPEGATHRVADSKLRPEADAHAPSPEHPLPKANEHIPTVAAWVPPDHSVDPLTAMRRKPGPPLATWGAWLGLAAAVAWFLGPIALGIGVWTMNLARQHDYSRARPLAAIVGGAIGTLMGVAFVIAWR